MRMLDGLINFVSNVGTSRDKVSQYQYRYLQLTQDQIETMYTGDWLGRKIVDIVPQDMTREWRSWQAKEAEAIYATEKQFKVRSLVRKALTWARLYGGAAILIGDGSIDPTKPLDVTTFKRGGLKYLHVFHRHDLSIETWNNDFTSPDYGKPELFRVTRSIRGGAINQPLIHRSRFVMFEGVDAPAAIKDFNDGWGLPVYQAIWQAIILPSAAAANAAAMTEEAKIDVIKVDNLNALLADPKSESRLVSRFGLASTLKSTVNTLLLSGDETFERKQMSFAGLPELIHTHLEIASGAADVPLTRLLGQSPAGMNATGESDIRNYYDHLRSKQNTDLADTLECLDEVLIRHTLGDRPPEVVYEWSSLWQLAPTESANVGKQIADTAATLVGTGLFTQDEMRRSVADKLIAEGIYPTLDQHMDETLKLNEELEQDPPDDVGEGGTVSEPAAGDDPLEPAARVRRALVAA